MQTIASTLDVPSMPTLEIPHRAQAESEAALEPLVTSQFPESIHHIKMHNDKRKHPHSYYVVYMPEETALPSFKDLLVLNSGGGRYTGATWREGCKGKVGEEFGTAVDVVEEVWSANI